MCFPCLKPGLIANRGSRVAYVFQTRSRLHPMYPVGGRWRRLSQRISRSGRPSGGKGRRAPGKSGNPGRSRAVRALSSPAFPGGQRQRVGIAMALANDPEIIIADEPTTALDVTVQARILELLRDLQRERGMALLFIHPRLRHRFGILRARGRDEGWRIVETGKTREVLDNPQHAYTKRLIACVPELGTGERFLDRVGELFAGSKAEVAQ